MKAKSRRFKREKVTTIKLCKKDTLQFFFLNKIKQ